MAPCWLISQLRELSYFSNSNVNVTNTQFAAMEAGEHMVAAEEAMAVEPQQVVGTAAQAAMALHLEVAGAMTNTEEPGAARSATPTSDPASTTLISPRNSSFHSKRISTSNIRTSALVRIMKRIHGAPRSRS